MLLQKYMKIYGKNRRYPDEREGIQDHDGRRSGKLSHWHYTSGGGACVGDFNDRERRKAFEGKIGPDVLGR